jgi:hypothetical protein
VDVQATEQAFERLFNSPQLRRQMGEAGRERAVGVYDWKTVIGQYEALWAHLRDIRAKEGKDIKPLAHPWPARMDPFHAFASYPSQALTPQTVLALVDANVELALQRTLQYRQLAMIDFAKLILPSEDEIKAVLSAGTNQQSAEQWVQGVPTERRLYVLRLLAWLLKLGVLKVVS